MLEDHRPLRQAFRARGSNVVGAERRQHRRAHLPHQHRGEAGAEDDRRHDHVLEVLDRILRERDVDAGRQPVVVDGEEADHHQPEPEVRDAEPDERRARRDVVRGLSLLHRGDDPRGDPDQEPDHDREERELERDRQSVQDRLRDREVALVATEVSLQREPEPLHVLHGHRLVEPVVVPDRLHHRRVAVLGAERGRRIARQRAHADEHEHARKEQDDEGGSDPAEEEAAHRLDRYFLNPANCARIRPSP